LREALVRMLNSYRPLPFAATRFPVPARGRLPIGRRFDNLPHAVCPSDEAADGISEPLFHPAVRPNHDGNQIAVSASFIQYILAEFHMALLINDMLGVPFAQKLYAGVASADGVDNR
jgi:hypothetical protein